VNVVSKVGLILPSEVIVLHLIESSPPVKSFVFEIGCVIDTSQSWVGFFVFSEGESKAKGQSPDHYLINA